MKIIEWYIYDMNDNHIGETYEPETLSNDEVIEKLVTEYGYPERIYVKENDSYEE